ncbi:MAG: sporulation protein YqfD, partial [Eubacteriales bacterium]|nr:sporulation protein YqfD [Eubacteriales bacterium]
TAGKTWRDIMLVAMVRRLFGYVRFRMIGRGREAFLNAAAARGIPLWAIRKKGPDCGANAYARDYRTLARLARENVRMNRAEDRVRIVEGDLRAVRTLFPPASFDAAAANPPYRAVSEGKLPAHPDDAAARTETTASLADFCAAAAYLLPHGGEFTLCYPVSRLARLFSALTAVSLEPKYLTLLYPDAAHAPAVLVCRARKGAHPGLAAAPPVFTAHPESRRSAP